MKVTLAMEDWDFYIPSENHNEEKFLRFALSLKWLAGHETTSCELRSHNIDHFYVNSRNLWTWFYHEEIHSLFKNEKKINSIKCL